MSEWRIVLAMAACGLITFLIRLSFIAGARWLPNNPRFQALLRYVPPAVLAALIAPELFMREGEFALGLDNLRLFAGLAAIAVAVYLRNVLATIAAGMLVLWLLQWLV
ncbi:MAG: branched-chain amino acid transporter [Candidatus Dactylopiibacterium carminicum]|uniref:AzlD domain-containing protein n=1 Tax=Candidatus Dactylopiibacterium carminicum TaxID=857335 RepID=A0A272ETD2_9RHOO|nr:AzlD domain-containing protein [Candidatus Dactylopiibacterium carminicum]KAF7599353.1 AzlD domain-containing protein [Candidatus Dactylopiibacterium carminicum]PAS93363.1 MAG: branched-chain amino acid transporter [Candidatus Dactylopiibacterium carminicum]PAS98317.1 MAG: branched-chain amino acid transporter [Candidatus Dactylopiibacterium carminicum]PAS99360.1 MAG: hypothetical protein BSR46_08320 [Candidatus Dactylopiibacterium carminicum]